jgi:hypothetical protein
MKIDEFNAKFDFGEEIQNFDDSEFCENCNQFKEDFNEEDFDDQYFNEQDFDKRFKESYLYKIFENYYNKNFKKPESDELTKDEIKILKKMIKEYNDRSFN